VDALSPLNVQFERLAQSVAERVADLLRASVVVVDERGATVANSQAGLSRLLAEQIAGDGQGDVLRVPLRMGERSGEVIVGEPEGEEAISPRLANALVEMIINEAAVDVAQRAIIRMDARIVGDIVAIVAQGRWVERQQPDSRHPQVLQVIQFARQFAEIADAVCMAVVKGTHVKLIEDRIFIPERVRFHVNYMPCPGTLRCSRGYRAPAAGYPGRPPIAGPYLLLDQVTGSQAIFASACPACHRL
jgi:hypothetical protein